MGKKATILMPDTQFILEQMGEQIKEARLRRRISTELLAERANVSRTTIWAIEKGSPSVSIGSYAAVLHGIQGMDKDLLLIAQDQCLKNTFEQVGRIPRTRAPRKFALDEVN